MIQRALNRLFCEKLQKSPSMEAKALDPHGLRRLTTPPQTLIVCDTLDYLHQFAQHIF